MTYLNYQEYTDIGGVLDSTAFNRNIDRASAVIDAYTFNRIEKMSTVPVRAKAACRDLVEYYATNLNTNEKSVSSWSQSAGPVSESISYESKSDDDVKNDIQNIIFEYLWSTLDDNGTPVLYKGATS